MHYSLLQSKRQRRGTSLIEVLVVLVVLVVGVLAIARLFPAGFLSLRGAENNSYASRLAQGTLDVLRQDNASLADGIYMYRTDTQQFDPSISPESAAYLKPFAANAAYNDINKARYVSNETVTVPAVQGTVQASLHIVNFGPFEPNTLTVNSALWTAKNGDSRLNPSDPSGLTSIDNPIDELRAGEQTYLVDLQAGKIAVSPAVYAQTFVLTVQTSATAAPVSLNISLAASTAAIPYSGAWFAPSGTWRKADGTTATAPAAPWATAKLYRPFAQVATISSFDTDPYEYALYNPSGGPVGISTVAFNPLAGGRAGVQPLLARLSYSTQDWHILHEDRDVPAGGGTIRLALSGLKKVGDTQFDQTLFNGLGDSGYDVILLDRDDGTLYGLIGSGATQNALNTDDNSGPTSPSTIGVSYLNGRITLPAAFSGKHLRVFYAGVADWAVAVQKAPKFYTQVDSAAAVKAATAQTPNRFWLDTTNGRIAFPVCDAGKMVQITIGSQPPLSIPIPDALDPSGVQYVPVGTITGTPTVVVTGLSARAFVIWHERNNWKSRSIDTLLTHLD